MNFDPLNDFYQSLQDAADSKAPAKDGGAPPADGAKEEEPQFAVSQEVVTKIAVKFVNAMWATQFAKVLSTGLKMKTRSKGKYDAYYSSLTTTAEQEAYTKSVAYKSYMYSGYMLMVWGLYGWVAFFLKRFSDSAAAKQIALIAAQGNGFVGLALMALQLWKTFARDQCSTNSGYFQCWNDSSPTTLQAWKNSLYSGQSAGAYLLASQMIWLSFTTNKVLNSDLKFKRHDVEVESEQKNGDAPADGAAPADGSAAAPAPAPAAPAVDPSKVHPDVPDAQQFETVDGKNGTLVTKNGDRYTIVDGKITEKNGKPYKKAKKETKAQEKELEQQQEERNKFAEEKEPCTGWYCL